MKSDNEYGYTSPNVMVGQYLLGTLKDHQIVENLLQSKFIYNMEVSPHITIYLFEHQYHRY